MLGLLDTFSVSFMASRPSVARFLEMFAYDTAEKRARKVNTETEHRTDTFKVRWKHERMSNHPMGRESARAPAI